MSNEYEILEVGTKIDIKLLIGATGGGSNPHIVGRNTCWGPESEIIFECYEKDFDDLDANGKPTQKPTDKVKLLLGDTEYEDEEEPEGCDCWDDQVVTTSNCLAVKRSVLFGVDPVSGEFTTTQHTKTVYVKAVKPSKGWDDIVIKVRGIPRISNSDCPHCSTPDHVCKECKADPITFTNYLITIRTQEKPWNGAWSGPLSACPDENCPNPNCPTECCCLEGGPEDKGIRPIFKNNGKTDHRRWHHLWTVNKNAIRAKVKPECLGELVRDTTFELPNESILPVGQFEEPHNPPPSHIIPKWKEVLPQTNTYRGLRPRIHIQCKPCKMNNCVCYSSSSGSSSGSGSGSSYGATCTCSCNDSVADTVLGKPTDVAVWKPEFVSDRDVALGITRHNWRDRLPFKVQPGIPPFVPNADTYHCVFDRTAPQNVELETKATIFAASPRSVEYHFVASGGTGNTLYLTPSGNWSINSAGNNPIFTIETITDSSITGSGNVKIAKIKTATNLALVQNLPDALAFGIRASDLDKPSEFDDAVVTELTLDLNIDSDNNNGYLGWPDRSPIERLLQNDDYALGKLILPVTETPPNAPSRTLLRIYLPENLHANDDSIKIRFMVANNPYTLGNVFIHTKDIGISGNTVISNGSDYTLSELGYSSSGTIWLYLAAEPPESGYQTKTEVDAKAITDVHPSRTITASLYVNDKKVAEDSVKCLVAKKNSYYHEHYFDSSGSWIKPNEPLRAAIAAALIYNRWTQGKDPNSKTFGLKLLDHPELEKLGVLPGTRFLLTNPNSNTGLNAGLYRDGVTGKFILAFAGTEGIFNIDMLVNIIQAGGNWAVFIANLFKIPHWQYEYAMDIARALTQVPAIMKEGFSITGHSLGGGLASAAYCASGVKTYTFNAAGLHKDTVERWGNSEAIDNFNSANASGNILAYHTDYDIVRFLHDYLYAPSISFPYLPQRVLPEVLGVEKPLVSGESVMSLSALIGHFIAPVPNFVYDAIVTICTVQYKFIIALP